MRMYVNIIYCILFLSSIYSQCEDSLLILTMEDSWGDGWNGNEFCINNDCTTLYSGSVGTYEFCINLDIENSITCGGGDWQSEVFWTLTNFNGENLATGGAPFEGCVGGSCENEIIQFLEFDDNGQLREYYLYLPNSIEENAPLVFVLHGYSGSAGGIMSYSGMNEIASINGFAVCYPQGLSDQSGNNFWNVGYAFHNDQSVDDVNFLTNLAIHLQDEYNLSRVKTFSTGMSNGGDMSYMLACQANDVFRGIAPIAGSMMEEIYNTCDSSYPIPVFEIHGDNDNVTLWEGDMQNNDGWGAYYSIEEGIDLWVEINQCQNNEQIFIPDSNPNDGSYIVNHRYFECNDNTEVWLYQVVGGGHDWPGSFGNMDINTSEEIWSFFSQYAIILGDINNDGSINVLDAISGVNIILNNEYNSSADLNVDNTVNVLDIIQLVNVILNN